MKLTTRGQYGTRALLELALHYREGSIPLKDIARIQQLSLHYLEHIITPLVTAGIVLSVRGSRGGVSLAKPPEAIRLSEVIQVLEGSIAPVACVDDTKYCSRSDFCVTRDVWSELKNVIDGFLESISLQDLVERHKKKEQTETVMYHI